MRAIDSEKSRVFVELIFDAVEWSDFDESMDEVRRVRPDRDTVPRMRPGPFERLTLAHGEKLS